MLIIHPIAFRDPSAAFQILADDPMAVFLDSADTAGRTGRYSYIAADPFRIIAADGDTVTVNAIAVPAGNPFDALAEALSAFALEPGEAPVPFQTGAIGCFGYELGRHLERLPPSLPNPLGLPEMWVGLYDVVAAFDHVERRAWVLSSGWPEPMPQARRQRAERRAAALIRRLDTAPGGLPAPDWSRRGVWHPELDRAEVERRIARIIEYIRAGDVFQANFTQRLAARRPEGLDDFTLYRRLRALSPAPFAAFLRCGRGLTVASASPERFLHLDTAGRVEARPIKGTRRRDRDPARDAALAAELSSSVKDRAENLMIADLMRNDLSRICRIGSVRVPALCALESFASVHHLVSVIEGQLRPGRGPVDLLRATFPGGSVTGAPKVRAMEIIRELEPARRGLYCGSIGWIGFDGAMDTSIVIRTLTLAGDTILAQAGGGIVADSEPAAEYEESMVKLEALMAAVTGERV